MSEVFEEENDSLTKEERKRLDKAKAAMRRMEALKPMQ